MQGKDVIPFVESLVVGDIAGLADGTGSLSVMTNERGGIIDDTVITKVRCRASVCRALLSAGCTSAVRRR